MDKRYISACELGTYAGYCPHSAWLARAGVPTEWQVRQRLDEGRRAHEHTGIAVDVIARDDAVVNRERTEAIGEYRRISSVNRTVRLRSLERQVVAAYNDFRYQ